MTYIFIPNTVTQIGGFAFGGETLTIYCEADSQPEGWDIYWNSKNFGKFPVVWGQTQSDLPTTSNDTVNKFIIFINDGLKYVVTDSEKREVEVSKPSGAILKGNLIIPSTVENEGTIYTVTSLPQYAFSDCRELTSVFIPNSVNSIGMDAFINCTGLTKADFESTESVCGMQFGGCFANPLYYAHHLYMDGVEITELVVPSPVREIGNYAFINCSGLTSVFISGSVTTIGDEAFLGCEGLTSVSIPGSVTAIGDEAFFGCKGLTSVSIPNSIASIGNLVFFDCGNIQFNEYDNALYLGNADNPYFLLYEAKTKQITTCEVNEHCKIIYNEAFKNSFLQK